MQCRLSQFPSLHIDRVDGLYLVKYLPGIGQQLVQVVDVPPVERERESTSIDWLCNRLPPPLSLSL